MSTSEILIDIESSLGGSHCIPVDVPMVQVNEHVSELSFFRTYIPRSQLNVDARIGGYPASIFGFWEISGCDICGQGAQPGISKPVDTGHSCSHPFTLYPAAKEIAYLLKCRNLPDTAFWRVAEDEWKKQMKAIQKTVDEKEEKVIHMILEIYKFFGLAFAFHGLLITTAIQSYRCNDTLWWFLTLSLSATIVSIIGGIYKVRWIKFFWKSLHNDKPLLYECKHLLTKLTVTEGPGFNLIPLEDNNKSRYGNLETFLQNTIYPTFILVCLGAFGGICVGVLPFICNHSRYSFR